jgi:hypothetical protein
MAATVPVKIRVELDEVTVRALKDPAPRRDMENYPVALGDLVGQLCDRLELDSGVVGEIMVIYPSTLEVRVQLLNADGKKYVWGTDQDPDQLLTKPGDPRRGMLAEEIRVYRITTSRGEHHGDHASADHPVPQDPDR